MWNKSHIAALKDTKCLSSFKMKREFPWKRNQNKFKGPGTIMNQFGLSGDLNFYSFLFIH